MNGLELYERCAAIRAALPETVAPEFDALLEGLSNAATCVVCGQEVRAALRRFLRDHTEGEGR